MYVIKHVTESFCKNRISLFLVPVKVILTYLNFNLFAKIGLIDIFQFKFIPYSKERILSIIPGK